MDSRTSFGAFNTDPRCPMYALVVTLICLTAPGGLDRSDDDAFDRATYALVVALICLTAPGGRDMSARCWASTSCAVRAVEARGTRIFPGGLFPSFPSFNVIVGARRAPGDFVVL